MLHIYHIYYTTYQITVIIYQSLHIQRVFYVFKCSSGLRVRASSNNTNKGIGTPTYVYNTTPLSLSLSLSQGMAMDHWGRRHTDNYGPKFAKAITQSTHELATLQTLTSASQCDILN